MFSLTQAERDTCYQALIEQFSQSVEQGASLLDAMQQLVLCITATEFSDDIKGLWFDCFNEAMLTLDFDSAIPIPEAQQPQCIKAFSEALSSEVQTKLGHHSFNFRH